MANINFFIIDSFWVDEVFSGVLILLKANLVWSHRLAGSSLKRQAARWVLNDA